ncbi:hypothetical protein NSO95_08685 [Qipengyuania sp. RS5-5]|uniref:Elongation factor P n=1 Tax=Parerythrobacter lacustris TaxID=2969984 RepID=A0ABT1XQT1_9SPHN|nr:hypothetical protein [Parerythrobacter lacustris]
MSYRVTAFLIAIGLGTGASAAMGPLATLPHGEYVCSLPGDAGGSAWEVLPGKGFTIENASTYRTEAGAGVYLMTGNRVVFTRGPMKGMQFDRIGNSTLQWIDEAGKPGRVRCTRGSGAG